MNNDCFNENTNNAEIITEIRNKNDEEKLAFIKTLLSQTQEIERVVRNWGENVKNNVNKILYDEKNGKICRREWVVFEDETFYCAYCLCFSAMKNLFVDGVKYDRGCRISEKLKKHSSAAYHKAALNKFLECNNSVKACQNERKNVIKIVFKIILFLATHG